MLWADLRVGFGCNNACKFCDQSEDGEAETEEIARALGEIPHRDGVILAGGEVTLRPDLPVLLATARRLGFRRVAIQSNGRILAARGAAAHLRAQGLSDAIVAIHADRAEVHDWLVSVDGAWRQATAGARAAAACGIDTRLATVLTRSNLAALGGLPALATRLGASGLRFIVAREEGRAAENARMIVP
ncbi:MAG: radical SAM protein, partial [Deltaproteobacteria bacterium]|nr:radical SAM protein [Deltaproteobacteria bacterium]